MLFAPIIQFHVIEVTELDETERGEDSFGFSF